MPTEMKNSTAKASRKGGFFRCPMAELGFAHHHAGEERAQREGNAKQMGSAEGNAQCYGEHTETKQFTRAGLGHDVEKPRYDLAPDYEHQRNEDNDLGNGEKNDAAYAEAKP